MDADGTVLMFVFDAVNTLVKGQCGQSSAPCRSISGKI
jgi:hypothetical protein